MYPNMGIRLAFAASITTLALLCTFHCSQRPNVAPPAPTQVFAEAALPASANQPATATLPPSPPISEMNASVEDKVRQVARDFIKDLVPGSKTDGVFLLPFGVDNLYLAGVDTVLPGNGKTSRGTYDLLVREYVRKNGSTYWRAENLGPEEAARLRQRALAQ